MIRKFPGHDTQHPPGCVTWSDCPEPLTKPQEVCYTISMREKKLLCEALQALDEWAGYLTNEEQAMLDRLMKL